MSAHGLLLEGRGVTKRFGGLAAVTNVDFEVREGEILGVIGPNGAGKTTLFNLISGALPVTRGSIHFMSREVTRLSPADRCHQGIARTFQQGKLFPSLTVFENIVLAVMFGSSKHKSSFAAEQKAIRLLEAAGLAERKDSLAKGLTLAAQRRVEISRALATEPKLLLLDEVLAGLTPTEMAQGVELVRAVRDRGVTVLIVEHIMKAIMGLSDRIIVLHHGEKIAEGTPAEVANSETVRRVYLGEEVR